MFVWGVIGFTLTTEDERLLCRGDGEYYDQVEEKHMLFLRTERIEASLSLTVLVNLERLSQENGLPSSFLLA